MTKKEIRDGENENKRERDWKNKKKIERRENLKRNGKIVKI